MKNRREIDVAVQVGLYMVRCTAATTRLQADPLLCRCGQRMRVVGFITQAPVIRKILDHVGRRFEPPVLPGRAPPLFPEYSLDPFPDYGPQ